MRFILLISNFTIGLNQYSLKPQKRMSMKKNALAIYAFLLFHSLVAHKADLIVFSFDRPLQLYALLESTERYVKNVGDIQIIYRSSNERYERAYQEVFQRFASIVPIKQGDQPKSDFKPLTLQSLETTPHEYVIFAVDDIIMRDYIDCDECIAAMEKSGAYGFYLRLGKNITYCYMMNQANPVPPMQEVMRGVFSWKFSDAVYDWAYPNTVDMTMYRKKDIMQDFREMTYHAPNSCEGSWHGRSNRQMSKKGLCYAHSKMVNLPLNKVQTEIHNNRHENSVSAAELLDLFERGMKIDIDPLHIITNKSAHMGYMPTFIARDR